MIHPVIFVQDVGYTLVWEPLLGRVMLDGNTWNLRCLGVLLLEHIHHNLTQREILCTSL
jgi:hypothetical protein